MFVYLAAAYGVFLAVLGSVSGELELVACGTAMIAVSVLQAIGRAVTRARARRMQAAGWGPH
jgi:RNase P protein component